MNSATHTPSERIIYRKPVMFCVLPIDLSRHLNELKRYHAGTEDVEIVVGRRGPGDRRQSIGSAPDGAERRLDERRQAAVHTTAAEVGLELPRSLRRHADRIICTRRALPVHFQDAEHEADLLLAAANTDDDARDELRMRYHPRVYAGLSLTLSSRRALLLTDRVFDDLFAHHQTNTFGREVSSATGRVLATGRSRRRSH